MMGQHSRSESLFYYFRIEDQIPEDHLLRLIDRMLDALGSSKTKAPAESGGERIPTGAGWLLS